MGKRISDMELNGKPIDPNREYAVAGWASVAQPLDGRPVWDVVAEYLRDKKTIGHMELNEPRIKGAADNPGYAATRS
jgi:sulfur-oxidizing protein SoxB